MSVDLQGLSVLVTRPEPGCSNWCHLIEAHGGQAIPLPVIDILPTHDRALFKQQIKQLGDQDWIVFNSPQAVYMSIDDIHKEWPNLSTLVKFAAVGKGTAKVLEAFGYHVSYPKVDWSSEGLLALPDFSQVMQKKITIVRGKGGRGMLDQVLMQRGAAVLTMIAYERHLPKLSLEQPLTLLKQKKIQVIICTSYEGVKNLKTLFGTEAWSCLNQIPLLVVSERIKILAHDLGFQTIWVARNASDSAMLDALDRRKDQ